MHFAPDTEETLTFIVALGNTHPSASRSGLDEIPTPLSLTTMLDAVKYSGRFDRDDAELASVHQTRDLLRSVWTQSRDDLVASVNTMLQDGRALPYLYRHDHLDWHLHATPLDAPLAERMRVEAALGIADLVRADTTSRMRACDAFDCDGLFVDLSRNGSRRFCSIRCGNRMNMVAFRERASAE